MTKSSRANALHALIWLALALFSLAGNAHAGTPREVPLANGGRLVVYSDANLEDAQLAVLVNAGSLHEPADFPGLAHLLEHMILRSQVDASGLELRQWMQAHGGRQNAHTDYETTLYFASLSSASLGQGLQYWAQALQGVSVTAQAITTELTVLDQEFQNHSQSVRWRERDALKAMVTEAHPYQHWHPGSLQSLGSNSDNDLQQAMQTFQQSHYRAAGLTVAISGPQPTSKLIELGKSAFASLPASSNDINQNVDRLFTSADLPRQLDIKRPHTRQITLLYPNPGESNAIDRDVFHYLGYLIDHPGEAGLRRHLQQSGLLNSLAAGPGIALKQQNSFYISLHTTAAGWQHQQQILSAVDQYLQQLQKQALVPWRLAEHASRLQLQLQQQWAQASPLDRVKRLVHDDELNSLDTRPQTIFSDEFKQRLNFWLTQLRSDQVLTIRSHTALPNTQKSPVFQVPYTVRPSAQMPLSKALAKAETNNSFSLLRLPKANPLIPSQPLQRLPVTDSHTVNRLQSSRNIEFWQAQDGRRAWPTAELHMLLHQPQANSTLTAAVMTDLYVEIVNQQLTDLHHQLRSLGYSMAIRSDQSGGIYLRVEGNAEALDSTSQTLLKQLQSVAVDSTTLAHARDRLISQWRQHHRYDFEQLYDHLYAALLPQYWTVAERLTALNTVTVSALQNHVADLFPATRVNALTMGRIDDATSQLLAERLQTLTLEQSPSSNPEIRSYTPKPVANLVAHPTDQQLSSLPAYVSINTHHGANAYVMFHAASDTDLVTQYKVLLLRELMQPAFFHQLRTLQGLGYAVFALPLTIDHRSGVALTIESHTVSSQTLASYTEQFLNEFDGYFARLTSEQMEQARATVRRKMLWQNAPIKQRGDVLWQWVRQLPAENSERLLSSPALASSALDAISLAELHDYFRTQWLEKGRKGSLNFASMPTGQKQVRTTKLAPPAVRSIPVEG